jgi:hypothetical protein
LNWRYIALCTKKIGNSCIPNVLSLRVPSRKGVEAEGRRLMCEWVKSVGNGEWRRPLYSFSRLGGSRITAEVGIGGSQRAATAARVACNYFSGVRFSGQPGRSANPAPPCLALPAPELYAQPPFYIRAPPSHAHPAHAPLRILARLRSLWMCLLSQVHPADAHGRRQKRMMCDRRVVACSLEVRAPHQPVLR